MLELNRRDFLQTSAAALAMSAAGSFLPSTSMASTEGEPSMRFGLVTYLWGQDWDLPTLIANCESVGVHGVELRVEHAHKVEPTLSAKERGEVQARFADSPVVCLGPGTNQNFHSPDSAELQQNIEGAKAYLQLSHDIGGTGVKVKPNDLPKEVAHEKTFAQIGRSLNDLGRFAEGLGQEIRLEVHGLCKPLPYIHEIFSYVDQPNVGVCWNCNGEDLEGDGLEKNFRLVRSRFGRTLHVHQLDNEKYPYSQLFDLLIETKYAGWILLEDGAKPLPEDRVAALNTQRELFEQLIRGEPKS